MVFAMFAHYPSTSKMSLGDLKRLVNTGEGTFLEFKKTISSPEKIAREVCAFANTKGGTLLIGVNDNKTLAGVVSFYEESYLLAEALEVLCDPPVEHTTEIVELGDKEIVVVKVEEALHKPVFVKAGKKRVAYIRKKDESVRASKERVALLKTENKEEGITFQYGHNEQQLFMYLSEYGKITVPEYSRLISLNKYKSARILVNLVSLGVLRLFEENEVEYFTLSSEAF